MFTIYLGCKAHIHLGIRCQSQVLQSQFVSNVETTVTLCFLIHLHQVMPLNFGVVNLCICNRHIGLRITISGHYSQISWSILLRICPSISGGFKEVRHIRKKIYEFFRAIQIWSFIRSTILGMTLMPMISQKFPVWLGTITCIGNNMKAYLF